MSDSLTLYRTIIEMILNTRVHFHDIRCLVTFAWAIVGVLMEKSVHLSKWGDASNRWGEGRQQAKTVCALVEKRQNRARHDLSQVWSRLSLLTGEATRFTLRWTAAVCGMNL